MIGDVKGRTHQQEHAQEEQTVENEGSDQGEEAKERDEEGLGDTSSNSLGGAIAERLANLGQKLMGKIG